MKIPAIFHWPSPWLWGALGVLIASDAHGFWGLLKSVAVVTLIASVAFVLRSRFCRTHAGQAVGHGSEQATGLDQRLETIERRLTDTQDVMIALSEKVDQWEAERSRATGSPESTP